MGFIQTFIFFCFGMERKPNVSRLRPAKVSNYKSWLSCAKENSLSIWNLDQLMVNDHLPFRWNTLRNEHDQPTNQPVGNQSWDGHDDVFIECLSQWLWFQTSCRKLSFQIGVVSGFSCSDGRTDRMDRWADGTITMDLFIFLEVI